MRVFNVPASAPFLRTVIAALVDGRLVEGFTARADPDRLAQATLYLPTRRAGRMAREIFLDVLGSDAVLLPRIVALGDIDEDELEFAEAAEQFGGPAPLDIPPNWKSSNAGSRWRSWSRNGRNSAGDRIAACHRRPGIDTRIGDDLARLMDDMVTRGVDWNAFDGLVPDHLDRYWQLSLDS